MKIAHLRDVANVGANLTLALRRAGHQADLILPHESAERRLWLKALRMPARISEVLRLNARIRAGKYEIVHLHVANSGWMAVLGGYPYFLHCHGSEVRLGLYQPVRREIVTYSLRHAIHVFYVTPDLYEHIRPYRPDATLLPDPVDTELFAPDMLEQRQGGPLRVLIAVPLTTVKGPQVPYRAIEQLRREFSAQELELAAFGFGKDMGRYRGLANLPGVHYLGPTPHESMPGLYNGYDIIMGQAQIGSLGMIELESMACGKPVVCFCDLEAYASSYGEPPPVFSASTGTGMTQHLRKLLNDAPLRRELGQKGREWVVRHHGFASVAKELEARYTSYLATRGGRKPDPPSRIA